MDFFETVLNRHSVRQFLDTDIEKSKLDRILETVNAAPSAGDLQGFEVVLVGNLETKNALAVASYNQPHIVQAPAVLVFCANHLLSGSKYGQRGADLYAVQDATIAAAYCQLAATAEGLASVWVGAFDTAAVASAVGTPDHITPVAIIPIGYPAEVPTATPRRRLADLVHIGKF